MPPQVKFALTDLALHSADFDVSRGVEAVWETDRKVSQMTQARRTLIRRDAASLSTGMMSLTSLGRATAMTWVRGCSKRLDSVC